MENGEWGMENGEWRMGNGERKMENYLATMNAQTKWNGTIFAWHLLEEI